MNPAPTCSQNQLRGAEDPWTPYVPDASAPWDLRRVVHLHRRAGFAATWNELQRDRADGPEASIDRVLKGTSRVEGVPEGFERTAELLAEAAVASNDPNRLKAWWVFRMLFGPDPLGERLTLLWHDHFATSNLKVDNLALMRRQNECWREHARAPFGELLWAAVRDPALLIWLDAPANRAGKPNENLARELMELFTLGIGPYIEADVKEAARALTGWTVRDGAFEISATRHDPGVKTILGQTGPWDGDDLVNLLLEHPATAKRIAGRIVQLLMGEETGNDEATAALAEGLRERKLDIGWGVATVLRSRAFFEEANLRARVAGPVEFVIGAVRALELFDPPPSTLVLADWLARLGQDLFYPPNVGGWPSGRAWLSSRSLVARTNFAAAVVEGIGIGRSEPFDPLALAARHGFGRDQDAVLAFVADVLFGGAPTPGWRDRLATALGPMESWDAPAARRAVALMLASPEAQVH